ncbi:sensor histidine kinase [Salinarimonas ramus]|uniref:sensor histidine kinase n=1 Tax=Salinarimonas ramus TaxID=690164 RepID=UPI0016639F8E|nr:PAS domain-containing sensor histidine kinase [Salinarimonas ramus]
MKDKRRTPNADEEIGASGPGWLGLALVVSALVSALASFLILSGLTPIQPTESVTLNALFINIGFILALALMMAMQARRLLRARRAGAAGARLHLRFVGLFSGIATVPVVVVAVVASIALARGLEPWFSGWIDTLLQNTVEIAHEYRELQCRTLARETTLMAADLDRAKVLYDADPALFREFMRSRAVFLGFPVAMMVEPDGRVVEEIVNVPIPGLQVPGPEDLDDAEVEDALCLVPREDSVLRSILRLQEHDGRILFVTRFVDRRALDFPNEAEAGMSYYRLLEQLSNGIQVAFASMLAVITLIILLSAIWFGIGSADRLVSPIRRLIRATQQVAEGNFYVQVPVRRTEGDLAFLGQTFNAMTSELRRQHDGLTAASDLIDRRRRFTEAVLSGVSAGVIGLDAHGAVTIMNPSAERLFGVLEADVVGRPAIDALPELAALVETARASRTRLTQEQIAIQRGGRERTVDVRVTSEQARGDEKGFVVTLDDITDLVAAQRTSAWADVARRIAHEIKNPLTPIQLSAERIRRKYGKVITEDRAVFDQCTDTIVRQVDDIKRMVDEFSSFARMPKPKLEGDEDLTDTLRQAVFMMRIAHPDIAFVDELPETPLHARFDRRLVSQAVTNILKNAAEAISESPDVPQGEGRISVGIAREDGILAIDVIDTGRGFPVENRQRLLEPYMTTREKGTGLGLPIVAKIFEEHGGGVELRDNPAGRGAWVRLWFPVEDAPAGRADETRAETAPASGATTP